MKRSVLAIVQLLAPPAFAADAFFSGVGDLPGGDPVSFVNAVSADGSLVIGSSEREDIRYFDGVPYDAGRSAGFVWTASGGMDEIEGSTGAIDVSVLGHVIGKAGNQVYRWTASGGFELMTAIGNVTGVRGVAADGSVIVGTRNISPQMPVRAWRWSDAGGLEDLGAGLPATNPTSNALAVSDDGNTVLGGGNGGYWTWTAATGMVALAPHPTEFVEAQRLSPDGSAHVGTLKPLDSAYLWTPDDGYVLIDSVTAHAVSADARVVVGGSNWALPGTFDAFIWDAVNGTRDLKTLLEDTYGRDLTGWTLKVALDVSHDGRTIVGNGINPDGEPEGWVAVLPHQCDDGLDNDADSLADASDPECAFPTWNDEANACGIGFELALVVPLLQLLYRRSRARRA